jgi:hypothetical protein
MLLTAHGFGVAMIAGLVNEGLATLTREYVKAGGKMIEVSRVRITDAGRDALGNSFPAPRVADCRSRRRPMLSGATALRASRTALRRVRSLPKSK